MAGIDFALVRSKTSIAEVLGLVGYRPSAIAPDQWRGPCPIHGSSAKSRSFSVNTQRNLYQCFKCGSGGNQLDLWAALTRQSLYEATIDLCNRLHLEIPSKEITPAPPKEQR
jgi:DNA primase